VSNQGQLTGEEAVSSVCVRRGHIWRL